MTFVHNLNQSFKKDKNDLTNKHSDLKNYVDLNFSSHPRIRKSEGNTLVDSKKIKKNIKRENTQKNLKWENKDKRENK